MDGSAALQGGTCRAKARRYNENDIRSLLQLLYTQLLDTTLGEPESNHPEIGPA